MALNTQSFQSLVQQQVASIQAACSTVLTFIIGSLELARTQAVAGVSMWLQALVMQLLGTTRLATSTGSDVDSFVGDFGLVREAAVAATGAVTFSRFTNAAQATIPVGTTLTTTDGTQQFIVIADTTQTYFNGSTNSYIIPAGTSPANATVQAVNAGVQGNVNANTITLISAAIVGVDTVTNALAYASGIDGESDSALQTRFQLYIAGLKEGIKAAVASAIANLQLGLQYSLTENFAYSGGAQPGYFYVVINPGTSGNISAAYAAIDAIRPLGITFGVFGATQITANVAMTATAATGYTHAQIVPAIQAVVQNFIAATQLGQPLYWSKLYAVVYAVPGVQEVTGMLLNGATADLAATNQQVIVSGTVTVS
jgi:uncharacterized phage protein gp47/JayE